jgi:hypothetical protein
MRNTLMVLGALAILALTACAGGQAYVGGDAGAHDQSH